MNTNDAFNWLGFFKNRDEYIEEIQNKHKNTMTT